MCVCEGSLDPATHKAPALASKADPDGLRTFIVLTKPDLMPPDNFWELVTKNKDRFKSRVGVVRPLCQPGFASAIYLLPAQLAEDMKELPNVDCWQKLWQGRLML